MKNLLLFIAFVYICTFRISAQTYSDYNHKGDLAFEKGDLFAATALYAEGLDVCDKYSVKRLTEIWINNLEIRSSLRIVMPYCFKCLKAQAEDPKERDAMYLLSECYKYGIGIEKDSVLADSWLREYVISIGGSSSVKENEISSTFQQPPLPDSDPAIARFFKKQRKFISYSYSPTMHCGLTLGFYNKVGGYLSAKSNFVSKDTELYCDNSAVIDYKRNSYYAFNDKEKWSNYALTGGVLIPISKKVLSSFGVGYAERAILCQINEYKYSTNYLISPPDLQEWAKNEESSYKGFTIEAGVLFNIKRFMISGGIYSVQLKDLDMYIGIGYVFN